MSFPGNGMGFQSFADVSLKLILKLLTTDYRMPSPTFHQKNPGSAQYPESFQGGNPFRPIPQSCFLERITLLISWKQRKRGRHHR